MYIKLHKIIGTSASILPTFSFRFGFAGFIIWIFFFFLVLHLFGCVFALQFGFTVLCCNSMHYLWICCISFWILCIALRFNLISFGYVASHFSFIALPFVLYFASFCSVPVHFISDSFWIPLILHLFCSLCSFVYSCCIALHCVDTT